ncbi:hypothetical protein [Geomonas propionica]|nr:hypothetical protein [Geomonas propionica]
MRLPCALAALILAASLCPLRAGAQFAGLKYTIDFNTQTITWIP